MGTLYLGRDFTGGEDMLIRSDDNLGEFAEQATSMVITGASSWTIYSEEFFGGYSMCLVPQAVVGSSGILYYAAWNVADLGIPNDVIPAMFAKWENTNVILYMQRTC